MSTRRHDRALRTRASARHRELRALSTRLLGLLGGGGVIVLRGGVGGVLRAVAAFVLLLVVVLVVLVVLFPGSWSLSSPRPFRAGDKGMGVVCYWNLDFICKCFFRARGPSRPPARSGRGLRHGSGMLLEC